ncbi:MAG: isomerizing glutamine--fructose-6-phosphate transaminase, partial [Candidatus Neomarinimicrobiota bacterium]
MCGIIGYLGQRPVVDVLLGGLHRLEYRGYDSAGITVLNEGGLQTVKKKGKVKDLEQVLPAFSGATLGLGHTRWATHGEPSDVNAHPHLDSSKRIALAHNGIVENHAALRRFLEDQGRTFVSDTDTEVLVEYISYVLDENDVSFAEAVRLALTRVVGAYGVVALCADCPDEIVAARLGSPLVLGIGEGEMLVASDASPIIEFTRNVVYLADGELAVIHRDSYDVWDIQQNAPVAKTEQQIDLTLEQIEKGGYPHFMLKEIMEQASTIPDAMRGRVDFDNGRVLLGGLADWESRLLDSKWIYITACGTSWHASLIGGYMLEELVGIPVKVDYASEFRYR